MKSMRIGIFGGSFNPIHKDHIKEIKSVLKKELVDEVWITPCKRHPFDKSLVKWKHRLNMIRLAIKNMGKVKICAIELKSRGKSYTINTLRKLKRKYPHKFFLIVGSDIPYEIKRWHRYKPLLKEAEFIMFKRKGYPIRKVAGMKIAYLITKNAADISSTAIREKAKCGKSLKNLVPSPVEKYIIKEGLYK